MDRSLYRYCVGRPGASSASSNSMYFIRAEYGFLLERGRHSTDAERVLLYRRMAKSFARAAMDCSIRMLESEEIRQIIEWFRKLLLNAQDRGFITLDDLPAGLRNTYINLLDLEGNYADYRKETDHKIGRFLDQGIPFVIFGCGVYGREVLYYLRSLGYSPICFIDNSDSLWGRRIEGLTIESPNKLRNMGMDVRCVIANENYADEIRNQIVSFMSEDHIFIF